jgi:hypothetical protein
MAHAKVVKIALPDAFFDSLGLPSLVVPARLNPPNRQIADAAVLAFEPAQSRRVN